MDALNLDNQLVRMLAIGSIDDIRSIQGPFYKAIAQIGSVQLEKSGLSYNKRPGFSQCLTVNVR